MKPRYNPSYPVGSAQFSVGVDPIYNELKSAYGEEKMYVMHWLLDVDDNFGFGNVQVNVLRKLQGRVPIRGRRANASEDRALEAPHSSTWALEASGKA